MLPKKPSGAGLGFRRELISELRSGVPPSIRFFEIAPENWLDMGGDSERDLRHFTERHPFVCHGLSLSIGGPGPLDEAHVKDIKRFMRDHGIGLYTEHLSWCADDAHLYDLLPISFTQDAVRWVSERILRVQDILGQRMGIENASYYFVPPGAEMSEIEFINAIVERADCALHLDVNNIFVNSRNLGFDALEFLESLPLDRVCYMHIAGHFVEPDGLIVDTHASPVIDPVWGLLQAALERVGGDIPICLERDFNIPPLAELVREVEQIAAAQAAVKAHAQ